MSLIEAERAIEYVRTTCGMRSCNRQADLLADPGAGERKIQASMDAFAAMSERPAASAQFDLMKEAEFFAQAQAGNCDEMAKVAFVYLAQKGVSPVEYAYLSAADASQVRLTGTHDVEDVEPDHALVIIGRSMSEQERSERAEGIISLPPYTEWNHGVVICDPWAKRAYLASQLAIEMQKINRVSAGRTAFSSEFRVDGVTPWSP